MWLCRIYWGNAWKFTAYIPDARIEVGKTKFGEHTALFVSDNGARFDMDYAEKLFTPFQRLHSKTKYEGSGIGLTTVQRIVNGHGGVIWAEGVVDEGATFFFRLDEAVIEHDRE